MSWNRNRAGFGRLALAALLLAVSGQAAANVLVVRSSGPSAAAWPPGRSVPDDARITLRAGDVLTVLDARGTRTFRGPGTFSPSAAVQASATTRSSPPDGRRARIGAVRSAGIVPASPASIWHVDVTQSGTVCLAAPQPTLWRAEDGEASEIAITAPDGTTRRLEWPAGAATLAWPADLAVREGADYQLRLRGSPVPSTVRFKPLQAVPDDVTGVAEALIRASCNEQLDLLIDTASN